MYEFLSIISNFIVSVNIVYLYLYIVYLDLFIYLTEVFYSVEVEHKVQLNIT